jgi:thiol-disulfide isomerase/thioredoxin
MTTNTDDRHTLGRARLRRDTPRAPGWRRWFRVVCCAAGLIGLAAALKGRFDEAPKVEPPFERLVDLAAGPVHEFALTDSDGQLHTMAEWANRPAIVLFLIATECPVSNGYAPEMSRLAREFGPRGILFLGIHSEPGLSAELAGRHAREFGLEFPVLLDPEGSLAHQAAVRVTPEAVVLSPDGQIYYRGRIDDRYAPDGRHRPSAQSRELQTALEAILAGESPLITQTKAFGCPLFLGTELGTRKRAKKITFAQHVAPILWNHCTRCHRPGEVAPFALSTYKDAAKRADFIRDVTADGRMPPWKPHSGAGVLLDAARLSTTEIETLRLWSESGCPEGDPALATSPPEFTDGWQLGRPDLVLTMPEPYVVAASGPDVYRSFPIPFPLDHDVTINGVEFRPGNRRVVHHSRMHLDTTGDARRRDLLDDEPGFAASWGASGGPELPYPGIGAWTPGMTPRFAPEGVGRVVPKGALVVVQVHYHATGKRETDQSRIGLFFARKPITKTMAGYTLCTDRIDIPAGEKRHKLFLSTKIKAGIHLYTVVPHAHYLCREFRLAATLPDGTVQPLLWITDWDLDWQDQYRFAQPVRLPAGTILTLAAYFDNSADNPRNPNNPPRRVRYGIETKDEMCACHLEFLPDDPGGYKVYNQKSPFGL